MRRQQVLLKRQTSLSFATEVCCVRLYLAKRLPVAVVAGGNRVVTTGIGTLKTVTLPRTKQ